jgi:hypothetical protein
MINICIIGAGRIAKIHAQNLSTISEVNIWHSLIIGQIVMILPMIARELLVKKMCMIGYGVKSFNITMPVICQDHYYSIDQFLIIKDGRIV